MSLKRDEFGDLPQARDYLDPADIAEHRRSGRELGPNTAGLVEKAVAAWAEDVADERFKWEHRNCPSVSWICGGCEETQCPDHHPSPAEEELCATCYWRTDPGETA